MPTLTIHHIRIMFCTIGAVVLGAMAVMDYVNQLPKVALFTAILALVLILNGASMLWRKQDTNTSKTDALFLLLLASFSLLIADLDGRHADWTYFFPIAAFFMFSLRTAIFCVLAYAPLAFYIYFQYTPTLTQAQSIFSFSAISLVALFLAMVQSRTNQLLEPLISSDEATGAQLESFMRPALKKEINRAEREGTGLLLVYLKHQKNQYGRGLSSDILTQCAKAISQHLRPFDQYYRLYKDDFAIIMPNANTQDATITVKQMANDMPESIRNNIEVGFASLNVGDTEDSLIQQAQQELIHV